VSALLASATAELRSVPLTAINTGLCLSLDESWGSGHLTRIRCRDVVQSHTLEYLAYLRIATIRSFQNIFFTLNLLALSPVLMIRPAFEATQTEDRNLARITLLVLMLTLATVIPFAYIHPRYLPRLFGLLLVAGFLGLREAIGREAPIRWAVVSLTIIIVAGNLLRFGDFLALLQRVVPFDVAGVRQLLAAAIR
jgi:hypothetical protein